MNNKNNLLLISALLLTACGGGSSSGDSDSSTPDTDSPVITDTDRDGDGVVNDADYLPDNPYISGAVVITGNIDRDTGNTNVDFSYTMALNSAGLVNGPAVTQSFIPLYNQAYPYADSGIVLGYSEYDAGVPTDVTVTDFGSGDQPLTIRTTTSGNLSSLETYSYNSNGLSTISKDSNGDGVTDQTIQHIYDDAGRLEKIRTRAESTGGFSTISEYSYNASGNMTPETLDSNGDGNIDFTYIYEYNANGKVTQKTTLNGSFTIARIEHFTYFPSGELKSYAIDTGGNDVFDTYELYNSLGSVTAMYSDYDSNDASYRTYSAISYRSDGQISSISCDSDGDTVEDTRLTTTYSAAGKLTGSRYLISEVEDWYATVDYGPTDISLVTLYDSNDDTQLSAVRYVYDNDGRVSERAQFVDDESAFIFTHRYQYLGNTSQLPAINPFTDMTIPGCN